MSSPPTTYVRQADFTGFSSAHPDEQQNGVDLDNEFDAIKVTTDQIRTRLGEVQRSDGALQNQIVTLDSLSSNVLAFFTALGTTPRGNWLTTTAYASHDLVVQSSAVYICAIAHTAGVFATDLAAGKWQLLSNASANQTLNTTSSVQFSSITATGNVAISGTLGAGNTTVSGYLLVNTASLVGTEKARVNGNLFVDGGILQTAGFKTVVNSKLNQATGGNCDLFHVTNNALGVGSPDGHMGIKLRVEVYNNDVQPDYAYYYAEYFIRVRSSGGSVNNAIGGAILSSIATINAAVINIDGQGVNIAQSGDTLVIYLNPTISGSGGSVRYNVFAYAEAIGVNSDTLVPV